MGRRRGGSLLPTKKRVFDKYAFGGDLMKPKRRKKKREVIEKLDENFLSRQRYGLPATDVKVLTKQLKKITKKNIWQPMPNSRMNTMGDFIKAPLPQRRDSFAKNFLSTVNGHTKLSRWADTPYETNYRTGKLIPLRGTERDVYREWMGQGNHPILTEVAEYVGQM